MTKTLTWLIAVGALLVLFVPLIVSDSLLFPYITGKHLAFRIVVEFTFALWLVMCLYDRSWRPRASLILWSFLGLLGVMYVANHTGVNPVRSFWSNFERMDGYISLLHFFAYFLILSSLFRVKQIVFFGKAYPFLTLFLWTALWAAVLVGLTALAQIGAMTETTSNWRVTGTTGNAAYMALYMLFSTFVAVLLAIQSRTTWRRYALMGLAVLFVFLLVQTATRGVVIGLGVSAFATTLYLALFWHTKRTLRQVIVGSMLAIIMAAGSLWVFHDSATIQNNRILQRATNINLTELTVRMTVWDVALEGVKERPILGWGQENFPVVFSKYYDPSLGNQEPWFDRAHNVFLDWLVAGGVLGLTAYLMLFVSAAWYVLVRPWVTAKTAFSVPEQAFLFGISAGYFVQNLVVFDTLISYIYFAAILAYIHARVGVDWKLVTLPTLTADKTYNVALPTAAILAVAVVFMVNVPVMKAAQGAVAGLTAKTPDKQLEYFSDAFYASKMGRDEVLRMSFDTLRPVMTNNQVATTTKQTVRNQLEILMAEADADRNPSVQEATARYQFYITHDAKVALQYAEAARELGQHKTDLLINEGVAHYQSDDTAGAVSLWTEAYEAYPDGIQAQVFMAAVWLLTGESQRIAAELSAPAWERIMTDSFIESIAYQQNEYVFLQDIYQQKILSGAADQRTYINAALLYYESKDLPAAKEMLAEAAQKFPMYKAVFGCAIANIDKNAPLDQPCE